MSTSAIPDDGAFWFLHNRMRIRLSHAGAPDGVSVIESSAAHGDSPPLHVHRTEDEVFHVLEGTVHFRVGDADRTAAAGDILVGPKGVPHTYCVESPSARFLTITCKGDFEAFVRSLARPAEGPGLPPRSGPPTPEQAAALAAAARAHGIDLVGPPLTPTGAAGAVPAGA